MHHYVALTWDVRDRSAADEAQWMARLITEHADGWKSETLTSGFILLHAEPSPSFRTYVLPQGCGFILGRLFRNTDGPAAAEDAVVSSEEAGSIVASDGGMLTDKFWGGYVAFLHDAVRCVTCVIRDCSGRVPCYWSKRGAVDIFFCDICDVADLLPSPAIDWAYIAAFIHLNDMQIRRTGVTGVTELLAGDIVLRTSAGARHLCLWSPERACARGRTDDYARARAELQVAAATCVQSWASVHANIVHSLSGGFDSALVLGWLMQAAQRPRITCLNRFTVSPQEDERQYARLAARRAGVELIEAEWRDGERRLNEAIFSLPRSPKPAVPAIWAMLDLGLRNEVAERSRATAISTGQGGDHLFLHIEAAVAAADFLVNRGIRPGLLKVLDETARLSRTSFWEVARKSLTARYVAKRVATNPLAQYKRFFVCPDALPDDLENYVSHPWVLTSSARSPGHLLQAMAIGNLTNRHRPLGDMEYAEEIHPLISQPLIECCLRIPSYLHLRGGRRRALAKDAFASVVPDEIRRREDKGSMMSVTVGVLRESRTFLREMLLDGVLAQQRLLNVAELETILKHAQPIRADQLYPLLACVAAEVWTRAWRVPVASRVTTDVRVA
jgi:asparagine synthase (glutamine-hydrolysing)